MTNADPVEVSTETSPGAPADLEPPEPKKGRLRRKIMPIAMRYSLLRRGIGIQVVYRSNTGGLIGSGLSYAALFALIPTLVLVVAGIFWLVDDPDFRNEAVELINRIVPAFSGFTDKAVEGARGLATGAGIIALIGFMWGASGLYLNLTRAMERFFPGERVSGALARVVGVLLVLAMIIAVLVAVFVAGVVTVIARALQLDAEWILTAFSAAATFALAAAIVYGIYRLIPANPPSAHSARLPAVLVGAAIALMTLLYSVISPWLVSGYAMFGVMASVFVALVWLRVVFMAMVYGAAMARYRDYVFAAEVLGDGDPSVTATRHAMSEEADRAAREVQGIRELERATEAATTATDSDGSEDGGVEGPTDQQPPAASGDQA